MIYINDNIKVINNNIIGKVKDIKEYFKYKIADLCLEHLKDYEEFIYNTRTILNLLEDLDLENDLEKKIVVSTAPMGNLIYENYNEGEW